MSAVWAVIRSRMGRRMARVAVVAALLPLLLAGLGVLRDARLNHETQVEAQLRGQSAALARTLEARLAAADSLARAVVAASDKPNAAALRASVADSRLFDHVVVDEGAAGRPLDGLGSVAAAREPTHVFIARPINASGSIAYFFIAENWLWRDFAATDADTAVLDAEGHLVRTSSTPSPELVATLQGQAAVRGADAAPTEDGDAAAVRRLSWHVDGVEWIGVATAFAAPQHGGRGGVWQVIHFQRAGGWQQGLGGSFAMLLLIAAIAVGVALWLSGAASSHHLLPLVELQGALLRLGAQRFTPLRANDADEVSGVVDAFNDVGARLDARLHALETLGEIDCLLLEASELEPVLDAILARVQSVTRCHTVGIALLDRDSPQLGRVIAATDTVAALPVSRVEFENDMYEHLLHSGEALTIARCEDVRHSFLAPLREHGSEFFWVWPVHSNNRLTAVLAIGFREAPVPDPTLAQHGAQFATRLAFAVSKTARDEHLYRQAHFDPLTSLPNRLLFRDRLTQELANVHEAHSRGALLYIDLDHFKKVNDTVGHAAGDQLLTIVAQRLRSTVKEGDTVARLGGDEFTVILRNVTDPDGAALVAERVVEALKMPVNIGGRDHFVAASIGITLFPDDGNSIEELMHNADIAMYRAKEVGRGRAVFFDRSLMTTRLDPTQSGLYRALRRREFSLFYQPQFNIADGSLAGLEALLRWNTPRDGTRQPEEFIPAAEASGLIVDIGSWVLEAACAQLAVWREQGIAPARVSVNVSAQQLKFVEFPRNVRRTLEKYSIPPQLLEIEITESVFADETAGLVMAQLAAIGVRLALDDFGTGYSSLNYLRQFPIQVVKIDRSFIEDISINPSSGTLAATIITMAHALGKEVVAEGVETEEQLHFLRDRNCDLAQGFYLAYPQAVTSITEMLQSRAGRQQPADEAMRQTG